MGMSWHTLALSACGLLTASLLSQPVAASAVGDAETCLMCHQAPTVIAILQTPHAPGAHLSCQTCHGDTEAHLANPMTVKPLAFGAASQAPVEQQNAACLACHGTSKGQDWHGHVTSNAGMACSNCHSAHQPSQVSHTLGPRNEGEPEVDELTKFLAMLITMSTVTIALTMVVLLARRLLVAPGKVHIGLDSNTPALEVAPGDSLLNTLASQGIFLASACGGRGLCGECRVRVTHGGGAPLATELSLLSHLEVRDQTRLACQVKVKADLSVSLPSECFGTGRWQCRVRSTRHVATFIKELVLELPPEARLTYQAGSYIQVACPPHRLRYADFDIEVPFRDRWDALELWRFTSEVDRVCHRAYSLANSPAEAGIATLNVRIEPPPPDHPNLPPGVVSSYLFSLKPGDPVTIAGPFGKLHAQDGNTELVIIGGGAGMAPLRSLIFDQLAVRHSQRKISFWYGARSLREAFYVEEFERLAREHSNFRWTLALSAPQLEDDWRGATGFVHQVAYDAYLATHPAPEDADYFLCGPPVMIEACLAMLDSLGVEAANIHCDSFG